MWSSNHFFASRCFRIFHCPDFQSPDFSGSRFFWAQVFMCPGFSGSRFFRVQVFLAPGFSRSRFFRVWVQGLGLGFRSSLKNVMFYLWILVTTKFLMLLVLSFQLVYLSFSCSYCYCHDCFLPLSSCRWYFWFLVCCLFFMFYLWDF